MIDSLVIDELRRTVLNFEHEAPYAFALIQGQQCNYLGYAVATSMALAETVQQYINSGYRYHGTQALSDSVAIRTWLKWANPDDGWHYCDFEDNGAIREYLDMHKGSDLSLRKGCLEQLKTVITQRGIDDVTLGVTCGEDPEEFRDSVIQIYGKAGHKNFVAEYDTMSRLNADIRRA